MVNNDLPGNPRLLIVVGDADGDINIQGNSMNVDVIDLGSATHNLTFTCDVNLGQDGVFSVGSGRTLTIGNVNTNGNHLTTGGTININTISGGGSLYVDDGRTTFNTAISNKPSVQISNGAEVNINGAAMDAGDVTVNSGGQLAMNGNSGSVGSLSGSGEVNLGGGGGTFTIDEATGGTVTWSGNISGNGNVVADGIGSRYFTATNQMVGLFTANNGGVHLTGSFPNANMVFNNGTTLSGTGSVGGTVTCNGADIYPGTNGAAGTLQAGAWVLDNSSTYHWDNRGGGNQDQIRANGTADINNANFALGTISGVYGGDTVEAMTAVGGVTGTFSNMGHLAQVSQGIYSFEAQYLANLLQMFALTGQSSGGGGDNTPTPTPTPDPGPVTRPPSSPPQMIGPNGQPLPSGSSPDYSGSSTGFTFCWDKAADTAWTNIYRGDTPNGPKTLLGGTKGACYTDTSGDPGTQYYYSTEACNDGGCSSSSGYVVGKKAEVNKGFAMDINQDGTEDMIFWDPDKKSLVIRYGDGHAVRLDMSPDTDFDPQTCTSMSFSYGEGAPSLIYTDNTGAVGKLVIVGGGDPVETSYQPQAQESGDLVIKPLGKLDSANVSVHYGDFNGDGYGDLLLREMLSGKLSIWLLRGDEVTGKPPLNLGADLYAQQTDPENLPRCAETLNWEVLCVCDFNGDGKADILWLEPVQEQIFLWFMNGNTVTGCGSLGDIDYEQWMFRGSADFDGDGIADLLWRDRKDGALRIWFLNGTQVLAKQDVDTRYGLDWRLKGTGDFNGDGRADIYWRHYGDWEVMFWFMDGALLAGSQSLGTQEYFQPFQN
ncbi:MAG: FG-GAP-like repeat-containing protein [Desulfarculaceae bacterium]